MPDMQVAPVALAVILKIFFMTMAAAGLGTSYPDLAADLLITKREAWADKFSALCFHVQKSSPLSF